MPSRIVESQRNAETVPRIVVRSRGSSLNVKHIKLLPGAVNHGHEKYETSKYVQNGPDTVSVEDVHSRVASVPRASRTRSEYQQLCDNLSNMST